jgi:hypothetical protein
MNNIMKWEKSIGMGFNLDEVQWNLIGMGFNPFHLIRCFSNDGH